MDNGQAPQGLSSQSESLIRMAFSIARTESEGPGWRYALWVQGCDLGCADCCNPELWTTEGGRLVSVKRLLAKLQAARRQARKFGHDLEGVSLLGGEPYQQHLPLAKLTREVQALGLTVMVYSGYRFEEIQAMNSPLTASTDLLVAGRYEKDKHTTKRRWIGSTNQTLHCLTTAYQEADPRFFEPNSAEIVLNNQGELTLVGFPFQSLRKEFRKKLGHFDV